MDLKLPTEEMESRREWGDGKGEEEMGNVKQEEGETQCHKDYLALPVSFSLHC